MQIFCWHVVFKTNLIQSCLLKKKDSDVYKISENFPTQIKGKLGILQDLHYKASNKNTQILPKSPNAWNCPTVNIEHRL